MEKTINKKELKSIFNLSAPDPADRELDSIPYPKSIAKFLTPKDFADLKKRIKLTKKQNAYNIVNKKSEESKVIRIKSESYTHLKELEEDLLLNGVPIKISGLVEFLLLKGLGKL